MNLGQEFSTGSFEQESTLFRVNPNSLFLFHCSNHYTFSNKGISLNWFVLESRLSPLYEGKFCVSNFTMNRSLFSILSPKQVSTGSFREFLCLDLDLDSPNRWIVVKRGKETWNEDRGGGIEEAAGKSFGWTWSAFSQLALRSLLKSLFLSCHPGLFPFLHMKLVPKVPVERTIQNLSLKERHG